VGGEIFQIATYRETTVNEIAEIIYTQPRKGDMKRNYADISKAKRLLGFEPEYDVKRGINETFHFFVNNRA